MNNSGTITGDKVGVLADETNTGAIVINNTGTIRGTDAAIRTGAGDDRITTSGLIDGNIETRGGNDTIYVTGGAINGSIDGGDGTNVLNFNLPGDVTFTFSHDILNMSQVNINSGTVWLNGQVTGDTTIASGATLGGNFTISAVWATTARSRRATASARPPSPATTHRPTAASWRSRSPGRRPAR